jgi:hypothetical protein
MPMRTCPLVGLAVALFKTGRTRRFTGGEHRVMDLARSRRAARLHHTSRFGMIGRGALALAALILAVPAVAQDLPAQVNWRYDEDWSVLRDRNPATLPDWIPAKYQPISADVNSGSVRALKPAPDTKVFSTICGVAPPRRTMGICGYGLCPMPIFTQARSAHSSKE